MTATRGNNIQKGARKSRMQTRKCGVDFRTTGVAFLYDRCLESASARFHGNLNRVI